MEIRDPGQAYEGQEIDGEYRKVQFSRSQEGLTDVPQLAKNHTNKQGSWRSQKVLTGKSAREECSHTLSPEYSRDRGKRTGCLQQTLGDSG